MIPRESKVDYLEAERLAPALIKEESDPIKFLRVEDYNPWKSARRLVLYWEYRKALFGNRYLLAMNDTGAGALNDEDIVLLKKGWLAYAVPHEPNQHRFILINQERDSGYSLECHLRVSFFVLSTASDITAQKVGCSVIRLITEQPPAMTVPRFNIAKRAFAMMKDAMPVRLVRVFLLDLQTNDIGRLTTFCMNRVSSMLVSLLNTEMPFRVPLPNSLSAAQELGAMGVPSDVLPPNHGGSWTYDQLFDWKHIVETEDDIGRMIKIPWITIDSHSSSKDKTKVNALYARRAYHKRKVKTSEDEQKAKDLRIENERLKKENAFLESLLQQAADVVALLGDDLVDFDVPSVNYHQMHFSLYDAPENFQPFTAGQYNPPYL